MPYDSKLAWRGSNLRPLTLLLIATLFLWGCSADKPQTATEAVALMTKQNDDKAIKTGEDWLNSHPEETAHRGALYEQLAIHYLLKAARDSKHKEDWIRSAVSYYDKYLSSNQTAAVDIRFFSAGHGFASAGDLSSADSCLYYARAVTAFEHEAALVQGNNTTVDGKTFSLAPLRRQNEQALEEVKDKFAKSGCK
jgi:hypothetical protein